MKKLVVLSVLLGLLVVAMPVVAVDLSYAGELTYGFIFNADSWTEEYYNYWIDVDFAIDDFNTLKVEFEGYPLADTLEVIDPDTGDPAVIGVGELYVPVAKSTLDWFYTYWTLDIAGALGLEGVSAVLDTGHFRPQNNAWKVNSEYSTDRWRVRDFVDGMDLTVGYNDMIYGEVAFDSGIFDQTGDYTLLWLGAWGTFGPASAEVFYYKNDPVAAEWFSFAAKGAYDVSDIALSGTAYFAYNLGDSPTAGNEWAYGAGVKAAYSSMAALAVGLNGNDLDTLRVLTFELNLTPIEDAGVDVGAVFNLQDGAVETFDHLDISGWYALGATKLRVGYLYAKEVGGGLFTAMHADEAGGAPALGDGGIYVTADVSF
jgi:hypothetical protein